MGAFDGELYALGYRFKDAEKTSLERVEIRPRVGDRVCVDYPNKDITGIVVFCGKSIVVVELDKPYKDKWGGRMKYEESVPQHWTFYSCGK